MRSAWEMASTEPGLPRFNAAHRCRSLFSRAGLAFASHEHGACVPMRHASAGLLAAVLGDRHSASLFSCRLHARNAREVHRPSLRLACGSEVCLHDRGHSMHWHQPWHQSESRGHKLQATGTVSRLALSALPHTSQAGDLGLHITALQLHILQLYSCTG